MRGPAADSDARARLGARVLLVAIVLLAAALRLARPGHSPPGLHVDAAANAWNAACLLETGCDWHGKAWPIFYSRGFGENQSTLYYYALMPFQAVAGMSAATSALPSALGGVLSVLLLFAVGRRLFDRATGLVAAAFLALAPWHLLLSRWGHESGLVPLLTLLPLWALLAAGLPVGVARSDRPRVGRSFLAGALLGLACYGYYAMRLFLPVLLAALVLANAPEWRAIARERIGRRALLALGLGLAVTLGPLAVRHLTDPEISKRGREFLVWSESDSLAARAGKVAERYVEHFGPGFLFARGDTWRLHALPGSGPLPWYALPLLLLGAGFAVSGSRASPAARAMLAWVLVYPIADVVTRHPSLHLLRSAPGLVGLSLLAAVGAVRATAWLAERRRAWAWAAATVLAVAVGASGFTFGRAFFGAYDRDPAVRHYFNADLLEASVWLRDRLDRFDAVFFSCRDSAALHQPFAITVVGLRYDPKRWFRDVREVEPRQDTDVIQRYGKVRFLFDASDLRALRELERNGRPDRAVFVLRPGEWPDRTPVHTIRHPDGSEAFLIYEETL